MSRRLLPGLLLLAAIAVVARLVAGAVPALNDLVLAIAIGALLGNAVSLPASVEPGLAKSGLFLETGIVLLGASLSLGAVAAAGPRVALLVVGTVAFGLLAVTLAARAVGIPDPVAALLAAGASVCGVSAVVAAAGVLDVEESDIAYAAATVLLFDAVTLVTFPLIGELLALPARQFGVWAGLTMFSTGPVTAAGFAYAPGAGEWATLTKLVRNTLIGGVAVAYSVAYARGGPRLGQLWTEFPKFLLGFLLVATVANSGLLSPASLDRIGTATDWQFLLAFAGLGFDIRLDRMRETGIAPIGVVFGYLVVVGTLTLLAVRALGL
ncbi:YeiH family protein [Natronomonas sp. EA1]|uniref:YeiH family protein n=1 Tax=Natronomonas sp. EA1 TaxID=3421655 RepID=UPI003EBF98B8